MRSRPGRSDHKERHRREQANFGGNTRDKIGSRKPKTPASQSKYREWGRRSERIVHKLGADEDIAISRARL